MTRPRFDVIVPVWNEIRVIEGTLRSIGLAVRAWGNCEVIVVDNGSTDGTWEALQRLSQEVPLTLIQRPGAPIGAM
jgi:glycosyltransferase involved in cell wall biosynthesis